MIDAETALCVVFFILVISRIGLISLVDATSFPAASFAYLLPLYPFLAALAVLSIWNLVMRIRSRSDFKHSPERPMPCG